MEPDKNYLVVGLFVLLTALIAFFFALWVTGSGNKRVYLPYRIYFTESVSGLSVGSPVKFRGVEVGRVERIFIDAENTNQIVVDVNILKGTPVKADTVASLRLQGITGIAFVELSGGNPGLPTVEPQEKGDIPEIRSETSGISAIVNRMPELIDKTSVVADQAGKLISDQNVDAVTRMLTHLESVAASLDRQSRQLETLIVDSGAVARDVRQITEGSKQDIRELTANLKESSQQLSELMTRTNDASGIGYEELTQLLAEMKKASRDMRSLARSLEDNPSRLINPPEQRGVPAP